MFCTQNAVCMAMHWNAWKTLVVTAVSTLTVFSMNSLYDPLPKAQTKVHSCQQVHMVLMQKKTVRCLKASNVDG